MDKLDIIIGQIQDMRAEALAERKAWRDECTALHGRITKLYADGCAHGPEHAAISGKVEEHEKKLNQAGGAILAAGSFGGLLGWFIQTFRGHP